MMALMICTMNNEVMIDKEHWWLKQSI